MSRKLLLLLVAAFLVTRVVNISLAYRPLNYGAAFGDLQKYQRWGTALAEQHVSAYSRGDIEYPPAVLPFLAAAELVRLDGTEYGHGFIWVMGALDLIGFIRVMALSRRRGSWMGPLVWIAAVPLLGPIVYLRLDLIPAVATVWALERASVGRWGVSGLWLGLGAAAKIYPAFLMLPAIEVAPRLKRLLAGFILAIVAAALPFILTGAGGELLRDVVGYHFQRGVHVESTWGSGLLLASKFGYDMHPNFQFGAIEAISQSSELLKTIGLVLSIAALAFGWWVGSKYVKRGDVPRLTAAMFGLLSLLMFFGTVHSPQFTVWLIALSAVALALPVDKQLRRPLLSVLPIALLTQLVFPFTIGDVLAPFYEGGTQAGSSVGLGVLIARNVSVLLAGGFTLWRLRTHPARQRRVPPAIAPTTNAPAAATTRSESPPPDGGGRRSLASGGAGTEVGATVGVGDATLGRPTTLTVNSMR